MDTSLLDNPAFRRLCIENRIEPVFKGDKCLVLTCPHYPNDTVRKALEELIPIDMPRVFVEGMSAQITSSIRVMFAMFNVPAVQFRFMPGNRLLLEISELPQKTDLQPDSPLWEQLKNLLKKDLFVKTWEIRINGKVLQEPEDCENFELLPAVFEDADTEAPVPSASECVQAKQTVKCGKGNNDLPSSGQGFLPPDAAIDIRILLESTKSVEEFLNKLKS